MTPGAPPTTMTSISRRRPTPVGRLRTQQSRMPADSDAVSRLLNEIPHRPAAAGELLPLVYEHLRAIAMQRMREERAGHTLQATALVHEAYLRLARPLARKSDGLDNTAAGDTSTDAPPEGWESRAHFFRVAADAMRKILIDHARKRRADKRGGGKRPVSLTGAVDLASGADAHADPELTLALDEALLALRKEDARAAEVVHLRFFTGLGFADIARLLNVSERTVLREWAFARARLVQLIDPSTSSPDHNR